MSIVIVLLIIKFTTSYRASKKIKIQKEAVFRENLITSISQDKVLSDEDKVKIKTLSDRKLLIYLKNKQLMDMNKYFQLLRKEFNQE